MAALRVGSRGGDRNALARPEYGAGVLPQHFFGLAHSTDPHAIMNASYTPGATRLAPDDVNAICAAYPGQVPSGGCSCAEAGNGGHSAPAAWSALVLATALGRLRRRVGIRVGIREN